MSFDQRSQTTLFGAMRKSFGTYLWAAILFFVVVIAMGFSVGANWLGAGLAAFFLLLWVVQSYPVYRERLKDLADAKGALDFSEFRKLPSVADTLKKMGKNVPADRYGVPKMDGHSGRSFDGYIVGLTREPLLWSLLFGVSVILVIFASSRFDLSGNPFFFPASFVLFAFEIVILVVKTTQGRSRNYVSYAFFIKPRVYPIIRDHETDLGECVLLEDRFVFTLRNCPNVTFCIGKERKDTYAKVFVPFIGPDVAGFENESKLPGELATLVRRVMDVNSSHGTSESDWIDIERKCDTLAVTLYFEAIDDSDREELGLPRKIVEKMAAIGSILSAYYAP